MAEVTTSLGKFGWKITVVERIDVELVAEMKMQEAAMALQLRAPYAAVAARTPKRVWDALIKGL